MPNPIEEYLDLLSAGARFRAQVQQAPLPLRHMERLTTLDTRPALETLKHCEMLWLENAIRQTYPGSAHVDTQTIFLQGPPDASDPLNDFRLKSYRQPLPEVYALLDEACSFLKVHEVGRVMLVRLNPFGMIRPHRDEGAYARYFARFHLVLSTSPKCEFFVGGDRAHWAAGELWWFNHQLLHSVSNGPDPRIHLIIDAAAPGFTGALPRTAR